MPDGFHESFEQRVERLLHCLNDKLDSLITQVTNQGATMSAALDALTKQVAANTAVEASAVTLIQGLAAQIAASANDPVAIAALSTQLQTSATALAAAITANTPAAPAPTP